MKAVVVDGKGTKRKEKKSAMEREKDAADAVELTQAGFPFCGDQQMGKFALPRKKCQCKGNVQRRQTVFRRNLCILHFSSCLLQNTYMFWCARCHVAFSFLLLLFRVKIREIHHRS